MRRPPAASLRITVLVAGALTIAACAAPKSARGTAAANAARPPAPTTASSATPTRPRLATPTSAPVAVAVVPTAASLVAKAMANAAAQEWVHIDVSTTSGADVIAFSQDSGPTSGRQYITADGAHAQTVLVGGVVYAMGDAAAVTGYFEYPASQSARLTDKWVAFSPDDPDFANVSDGITLASALHDDTISGPYRVSPVTIVDGRQVLPISVTVPQSAGGPSATGTLYITPGSSTLPVELDLVGPDGSKSNVRYSSWGISVALRAPPGAIPAASIPGS